MAETQNTGQFAKTIVTDVGKDMIAKSQNGQTLTFSRVALGDGLVGEEEDVTKFTAVKNERLSLPIAKYSNLGNGQFQIQFRLTNSQVESGFWHREIGVMAKIDNGQEQLYAYTTAGNKASFIYDKTTPVEERIVNVNFVIGNAQNLEVIINSSVIYATVEDLEEALDAHDAGADAHEPAFAAHNADDNAHKDFTGATAETAGKRGMVPAPAAGDQDKFLTGAGVWQPVATTTQAEAGTDDTAPMTALKVKQAIDALVQGVPVGTILPFAGNSVPSGFLQCNGAGVSVTTYAALYKVIGNTYGGDSTTFNLPNLTDRFLQGSNTAGTVKAAGLPNITGTVRIRHAPNSNFYSDVESLSGAFYSNNQYSGNYIGGSVGSFTTHGLGFSANRSNAIYGKATTVQPPAVTVRFIIKY